MSEHTAENDAPKLTPAELDAAYASGEWCGECFPNRDGCCVIPPAMGDDE